MTTYSPNPTSNTNDRSVVGHKNKTPVSYLQEICTRMNLTPKYDLIQVEGSVHEPIYKYGMTLVYKGKTFRALGTGRSKKEARHNTARNVLRSMDIVAPHELFEMSENFTQNNSATNSGGDDGSKLSDLDGEANPVGILQELCMKMKYPPPIYSVEAEEGLPHERIFAMSCRISEHLVEIGKGKSKKIAKRASAFNMAQRLRSLPMEKQGGKLDERDDDVIIAKLKEMRVALGSPAQKSKFKPRRKKTTNSLTECSLLTFRYRSLSGPLIDSLRCSEFNTTDPIGFVSKLGSEQGFEVVYLPSEELSETGEVHLMVQLTMEPPVVLFGTGLTLKEAKVKAAIDVINYFKQMLRFRPALRPETPDPTSTKSALNTPPSENMSEKYADLLYGTKPSEAVANFESKLIPYYSQILGKN